MGPVSDREGRAGPLSLDDCRCPVCLEIFMEPVTLPCSHTFCKSCFLESVDKATLCCPMCRKRVSTWARQNSRNNTLVNQKLWSQIQTCFPLQCQRRLSGQEAEDDAAAVSVCFPRVSEPGELRQEYEDQITKLTEEKRVLDEEERKASEEYIQRLLAEEQDLLQQETKRREEDARLARLLSVQLNSATASQEILCPADVAPSKKKKEFGSGQIDRFLCPLPSKTSSSYFNKENIVFSQMERPLPKLNYYEPELLPLQPEDQTLGNQLITDGQPSSSKRKSSERAEEEEVGFTKRGYPAFSLEVGGVALQEEFQWEEELLSRQQQQQQQEEEDRRLALLLQKELDEEEKRRCTDRRKGSTDAYPLRQNRGGRVEASTPSRASRKTTKTSTSSPSSAAASKITKTSTASSSPSSSSKQTTLTELFSNLSS
ncbi:E3 ubiquitin-protein ligase rnf168 [Anabas testudineus]|uniref:RING-type E3 ubiquitin transferase n=1 Tax=Anabas testudineus TaxID=64144 RepID=A0A3Q1JBS0_ANATE|nr:E3 ubiquitin-protein ligase rnf168 [Anabas testudineus]